MMIIGIIAIRRTIITRNTWNIQLFGTTKTTTMACLSRSERMPLQNSNEKVKIPQGILTLSKRARTKMESQTLLFPNGLPPPPLSQLLLLSKWPHNQHCKRKQQQQQQVTKLHHQSLDHLCQSEAEDEVVVPPGVAKKASFGKSSPKRLFNCSKTNQKMFLSPFQRFRVVCSCGRA